MDLIADSSSVEEAAGGDRAGPASDVVASRVTAASSRSITFLSLAMVDVEGLRPAAYAQERPMIPRVKRIAIEQRSHALHEFPGFIVAE